MMKRRWKIVHKSNTHVSGGGGSGTVTEIDTGTGLTGGPVTTTGTISIANNTANTLAGFSNSGVFSDVAIGANLTLSGGTLNASGGTGTVSSVSVTTANGVSGSVANPTTTPAISLTLGAITPTSVNSVVVSGSSTPTLAVTGTSSVSGSNTGDQNLSPYAPLASPTFTGTVGGITAAMVGAPSGSGTSTGTNTGDQTNISGNAATVTTNANLTGDVTSVGNAATIALSVAHTWTGQQNFGSVTTNSSSNSTAWNLATAQNAKQTMTENTTLANPTNQVDGGVYQFKFTQHASSAKTLAFGNAYIFSGNSTINAAVSSVTLYTFVSDGTNMRGVMTQWAS